MPRIGGRGKGTPNKLTADLREMIEGALREAGGLEYLKTQAAENPAAFMSLVGKLIPKDLNVSGEIRHTLENMILAAARKPAQEPKALQ